MSDPVILWVSAAVLGLLLTTSAIHKFRDLPTFAGSFRGYDILPQFMIPVAAPLVATAELGAGLAALSEPFAGELGRYGIIGCAVILLVYAAAIGLNLLRGNSSIDCGCFGFGAHGPGLRVGMLVRNLGLAALAIPAAFPAGPRPIVWLDALTVIGGVALTGLLYAGAEIALALPQKETAA